ncbi:DNA cytosine methyltransferase [Cohnella silvisoli]|uniref:DNA cytosine methyltransferase n=1 Tax=Cohnella silvisoli TaxID=2873699 RepID=UPI00359F1385|nr:DNA cytosine methyltransferase [Cohnella silvisoli]
MSQVQPLPTAAVGGADIWPEAIDAYANNFTTGTSFLGDLTRMHTDYIPRVDSYWLSPACDTYSALGTMTNGITEGHGPHYARIVLTSGASMVMIEQVPAYLKSTSYQHLRRLLSPFFPHIHETKIDAYDVGSVASRTRGYAVLFRERTANCRNGHGCF